MEDFRGKFCVILAGYKEPMEEMIATNPGFDSRINRKIDFPDYTIEEMEQIFKLMLKDIKYNIEIEAMDAVKKVFDWHSKKKDFANARTIRNILDTLVEIQCVRVDEDYDNRNDNERIIRVADVKQYINEELC